VTFHVSSAVTYPHLSGSSFAEVAEPTAGMSVRQKEFSELQQRVPEN
jgi:hypothetical protein